MDVEITISYSDDRPCRGSLAQPDSGKILFMIVTPLSGIPRSVAEGLQEARRMFVIEPWTNPKSQRADVVVALKRPLEGEK
jgi:hypothetical protein